MRFRLRSRITSFLLAAAAWAAISAPQASAQLYPQVQECTNAFHASTAQERCPFLRAHGAAESSEDNSNTCGIFGSCASRCMSATPSQCFGSASHIHLRCTSALPTFGFSTFALRERKATVKDRKDGR